MLKRRLRIAYLFALAIVFAPALRAGQDTSAPQPIRAEYAHPTDRYPHNIMGRLMAHTDLIVAVERCTGCGPDPETLAIRLPEHLVFEDFAPRLVDLNGDGRNEIVVVESDQSKGARLAVWDVILKRGEPQLVRGAATDHIGTRFRWLSPVGAADFNGDGGIEFAYVEKPHLDKILRIVRRDGAQLRRVASIPGITNHAIGQEEVQSRIERCTDGPTIFALDASGQRILSIQMIGSFHKVIELGNAKVRHRLDVGSFCNQ